MNDKLQAVTKAPDPQARHDIVVSLFPGGLTPKQFRAVALASTDEDGRIDPPALADWFKQQSLLIGMWMDGLIERRCRRDEAGPYFITQKGRSALAGGTREETNA